MDYLRYYFGILMQPVGLVGILARGPDAGGLRMPGAFACFLASLIPPLWFWLIAWPRLHEWDFRQATPAERELARAENRKAGRPDWLGGAAEGRSGALEGAVPAH